MNFPEVLLENSATFHFLALKFLYCFEKPVSAIINTKLNRYFYVEITKKLLKYWFLFNNWFFFNDYEICNESNYFLTIISHPQ